MLMKDDMEFVEYVKKTTDEKLVFVYEKDDKLKTQADACIILNDAATKEYSIIDFSVKTVSKHLLETKWAQGKKNYCINEECRSFENDMRWYAFKDYESKSPSYFFIWGKIIKNANLETLNPQKVTLIPLDFVKRNSMTISDLMKHYHTEFANFLKSKDK